MFAAFEWNNGFNLTVDYKLNIKRAYKIFLKYFKCIFIFKQLGHSDISGIFKSSYTIYFQNIIL